MDMKCGDCGRSVGNANLSLDETGQADLTVEVSFDYTRHDAACGVGDALMGTHLRDPDASVTFRG